MKLSDLNAEINLLHTKFIDLYPPKDRLESIILKAAIKYGYLGAFENLGLKIQDYKDNL